MRQRIISTLFTLTIILIGSNQVLAQWALSEMNIAHQYDPGAEVFLKGKTMLVDDSLHLILDFHIKQQESQLYDYSFDVFLTNDLGQKLQTPKSKTQVDSSLLSSLGNIHVLKLSTTHSNAGWAIVKVSSGYSGFSFFFEFRITTINSPDFTLLEGGIPLVSNYAPIANYQSSENITAFYYRHDFGIALPPMSEGDMPAKSLTIDSVFSWRQYDFQNLSNPGLYYFQKDTASTIGQSVLITNKYFPELATLDHLIDPLIYITTRREKEQLDNVQSKKDFDQFWLDLTESPERAKRIIKEYYDRVEFANALFTNFKEGWKTDPGMIFIIFGPPDEVIKQNKKETWVYVQNSRLPKIRFEFIKSHNVFSSSQYTLLRKKNYDNIWFRAVDLWRKSRF